MLGERRLGGMGKGARWALALGMAALAAMGVGVRARAQDQGAREVRVSVVADNAAGEAALALLEHLGPGFWLKTQVKAVVARAGEMSAPDLIIAPEAEAERLAGVKETAAPTPVFRRDGAVFAAVVLFGDEDKPAARFFEWLRGDVAKRAIESYDAPDGAAFDADVGGAKEVAAAVSDATPEQLKEGENLSYRQCGRCHVIGERNKYGGIGSTPSFRALRGKPGWRENFEAFWTERPHGAFSQIEGVTEPFDPRFPPPVMPVELSLDQIDAIVAYVETLKPKDLGAPLKID